jgi:hypothetical protein
MQRSHDCDNGVKVETILLHESGEEFSGGILHVPAGKNDAQGYGSALTYARRYSLMAACGIAPEDDDGNAASKPAIKASPAPNLQPPQLSEYEVQAFMERVAHCGNVEDLKVIYSSYYKRANESQREALTVTKDNKKSQLEKAV